MPAASKRRRECTVGTRVGATVGRGPRACSGHSATESLSSRSLSAASCASKATRLVSNSSCAQRRPQARVRRIRHGALWSPPPSLLLPLPVSLLYTPSFVLKTALCRPGRRTGREEERPPPKGGGRPRVDPSCDGGIPRAHPTPLATNRRCYGVAHGYRWSGAPQVRPLRLGTPAPSRGEDWHRAGDQQRSLARGGRGRSPRRAS